MGFPSLYIDLSPDLDVIWRGIKKKRRGDIRHAERLGIQVLLDDGKFYNLWMLLFRENRRILGIPVGERMLQRKGYVFLAFDGDDLLAGEKLLLSGKALVTNIAFSKRYIPEKKTLSGLAHALLIWEEIKWAKTNGFKEFDFGGFNLEKHFEVSRWKESFGGVGNWRRI